MDTRRFARICYGLCFFVWLVVLSVPELRQIARYQLAGHNLYWDADTSSLDGAPGALIEPLGFTAPQSPSAVQLLKTHPGNRALQFAATDERAMAEKNKYEDDGPRSRPFGRMGSIARRLAVYDAAIKATPRDALLIAVRLRAAMQRRFGPSLSPALSRADAMGGWHEEFPPRPQLMDDLAMARLGHRDAPENSFFDFVAAAILFGLNRNEEGLAAIHRAGQAGHYDDYTAEEVRLREEADEAGGHRLVEQKFMVWASMPFPHYSIFLGTTRSAGWLALEAGRRGDVPRELQIESDLAHFGATIRDSNRFNLVMPVGTEIQGIAWERGDYAWASHLNRSDDAMAFLQSAQRFAHYAAKNGRPDLARKTLDEAAIDAKVLAKEHQPPLELFLTNPNGPVARSWWTSALVLCQWAWTFVALVIVEVALGSYRLAVRRLKRQDSADGRIAAVAAIDVGAVILWTGIATLVTLRALSAAWQGFDENQPETAYTATTAVCYLFAFFPVVIGFLLFLFGFCRRRLSNTDRGSTVLRIIITAMLGLLTACLVFALSPAAQPWELSMPSWRAMAIVFAAVCGTLFLGSALRTHRQGRGEAQAPMPVITLGYYIAGFRAALQGALCLAGLIYLALMLGSLPLRHRADAQADRVIRTGGNGLYG